jgi:3-deoxy-D-manno-octulosonic-acid transferase
VGEIYVALRFIRAYRKENPDAYFALSTNTSTAHAIGLKELDERDVLFYFPVDIPVVVRIVLRVIRPIRLVLVESEYWPNLIRIADMVGVRISLINGILSERSCKRYGLLRPLMADVLRRIDPFCVQSEVDADRLVRIGAPRDRVHVVGTVKFDVAQRSAEGERVAELVMERLKLPKKVQVLLGGSTWPGEEALLCASYKRLKKTFPNLFLVLVPRHVERGDEIVRVLQEQDLSFVRRSEVDGLSLTDAPDAPDVLFVDTTGELRNFYSVADLIFVGKSICEHGGQNPIEPAMYAKAVIVGPNMENFPSIMPIFLKNRAMIQLSGAEDLEPTLARLLGDEDERILLGERASGVVKEQRGAIRETVKWVEKVPVSEGLL